MRLSLFAASDASGVKAMRDIVASYSGGPVLFRVEKDQFEFALDASATWFRQQFDKAHAARTAPPLQERLNVALHVERGEIGTTPDLSNPNLTMRWNSDQYFLSSIDQRSRTDFGSRMAFDVYSQGHASAFGAFTTHSNVRLHPDTDLAETFLGLATADLLISSRSSLSYKAALLNEGLKTCPDAFWHGYPDEREWLIGSDPDGISLSTLNDCMGRILGAAAKG